MYPKRNSPPSDNPDSAYPINIEMLAGDGWESYVKEFLFVTCNNL